MISTTLAHPALVSEDDFIATQAVSAVPAPADGATRIYALIGLVRCRSCGRRMESHWVHHRPGYRCRHGHTSAKPTTPDRPKTLYLREDHILARLAPRLDQLGAPDHTAALDPTQVSSYLRAHHMTILCDASTCTPVIGSPTNQPEPQLIT